MTDLPSLVGTAEEMACVLSACHHVKARTSAEVASVCGEARPIVSQVLSYAHRQGLVDSRQYRTTGKLPTRRAHYRLTTSGEAFLDKHLPEKGEMV